MYGARTGAGAMLRKDALKLISPYSVTPLSRGGLLQVKGARV